ncbi:MAG: alpha/beta fold hydrolase [Burkholderiales bacterium]|nr:alpha/beta fold hydrolase [Burkholderiales bacterium]
MTADLVLVPGLNNTRAVFDRVLPHLPPGTRATAVDNPPLESVDAIAQALLPALPARFWLAGFSFGGYVALALLAAAPERVRGIALVCTAPGADSPAAAERRRASLEQVAQGRYFEMIEAQAALAFHPDSLADAALMAERAHMVRAYGPERFVAHVRATIARPDRTALLDGGRPTIVIGGSHDKAFPPEALAYARAIPGARLEMIEGAGHLVPMEKPAELARCLGAWMAAA